MAYYCTECGTRHNAEPRYCTGCGDEVNPDADPTEQLKNEQSFFQRHQLKILGVTAFMMLLQLPSILAAPSAGAAVGAITGGGVAALAIAYILVYIAAKLFAGPRESGAVQD